MYQFYVIKEAPYSLTLYNHSNNWMGKNNDNSLCGKCATEVIYQLIVQLKMPYTEGCHSNARAQLLKAVRWILYLLVWLWKNKWNMLTFFAKKDPYVWCSGNRFIRRRDERYSALHSWPNASYKINLWWQDMNISLQKDLPLTRCIDSLVRLFWQIITCQGLYSVSSKTSYRMISWSLEGNSLDFKPFQSIWKPCRDACQIAERYIWYNIPYRGFEASRDSTVRRLTAL